MPGAEHEWADGELPKALFWVLPSHWNGSKNVAISTGSIIIIKGNYFNEPPYTRPVRTVRLIDAFVDILDIERLGFTIRHKEKSDPGAPEYHPADLLKIYIYGYINRTRSSRQLERCCKINIEMMWLTNGLTPGYVTIANFRKNNPKALKQVFQAYNRFLQDEDLFGKETIAVDGAKISAQNSKKNNFSDKIIERHQKYIDKKASSYLALLDQTDEGANELMSNDEINEKLEQLAKRKTHYNNLQLQLNEAKKAGEKQISTTDSDARLFTSIGTKGEVAFNLQSAVDDKHKLIVYNEITNKIDTNALYQAASQAKKQLQVDQINVLADTGYDTGEELKKCAENNITTFVAPRVQNAGSKNKEFAKDKFDYNKQSDSYTCPKGELLTTNGKEYTKQRKGRKDAPFKEYKAKYTICNNCVKKEACAAKRLNRNQGRVIERYLTADFTEANQQRIKENKDYYRQRQSIVEHPFGTIKRQWGYSYTLVKGLEKVGGEFDIICLCYNMRRSVSILSVNKLIERLEVCFFRIGRIIVTATAIAAQILKKTFDLTSQHSVHLAREAYFKNTLMNSLTYGGVRGAPRSSMAGAVYSILRSYYFTKVHPL
jgi:transposase